MKDERVVQLDALISKVKEKIDNVGMTAADMFIVLTLEILRGELVSQSVISVGTVSACLEIYATTSHFYYYRDYPELYRAIHEYFTMLSRNDRRFISSETPTIGFDVKDWQKYVSNASIELLGLLPTQYFYKKQ